MTFRTGALMLAAIPAWAVAQAPATPTSPAPAAKAARDDKVVCRSITEIGSLVASKKECKTKREWDAERQATQDRVGECVNSGSATGARC